MIINSAARKTGEDLLLEMLRNTSYDADVAPDEDLPELGPDEEDDEDPEPDDADDEEPFPEPEPDVKPDSALPDRPPRTVSAYFSADAPMRSETILGRVLARALRIANGEVETSPTKAQRESGNYRKWHGRLYGLPIAIENPAGSVRRGTDDEGNGWERELTHHYGYIKRTEGGDGDALDCFVSRDRDWADDELSGAADFADDRIFVVNQVDPETQEFDEHKAMIGFGNAREAYEAYMEQYEDDWEGFGGMRSFDVSEFKEWLRKGNLRVAASSEREDGKRSR